MVEKETVSVDEMTPTKKPWKAPALSDLPLKETFGKPIQDNIPEGDDYAYGGGS